MPNTPNMEREPALTIGEIFASKALIKPIIAAAVAVIAGIVSLFIGDGTTITAGDDVIENLATLVMFAAMVYAPWAAKREQANLATDQAKATREAVYSPSSVKEIARASADAREPRVPPPPAK